MPKSAVAPRYRYLLGDSRTEAARLRRQARLWDPVAKSLFDRIGVRRGWKVLEIGPGQGSLHLELRRRVQGPVDAVEPSPAFATRLAKLCAKDGFGPGQIWRSLLLDAPIPANTYDFIFVRWVFLFLPDPAAHVKKLVRALKPGGILAIEDYHHRETVSMLPEPAEWQDFLAGERACFAAQGSDASVAAQLPPIYRAAGLDVIQIVPTIKIARPGTPEWRWMTTYFLGMMDRYATFPPFSPAKAARLVRAWHKAERDPASVMIAPAVVDMVGRKRKRRR